MPNIKISLMSIYILIKYILNSQSVNYNFTIKVTMN
ncbi:unnamed protein product [Staphylococcus haemolyticus JCSC1435]|uniref:Uncharacterized protein n=1 Tax=Staphylococcus haemolyticus (strain JCSC1435) TaxID=279808 RepID=Q4L454_STAHJ|nr:unnamed protein product [Staphylococcus haemolyticus JCSC1435]